MYCSHCGKEIPSNSQFCQYCGHRVNRGSSTELNKFSNLSSKQKQLLTIYGIWILLHCLLLAISLMLDHERGLYPYDNIYSYDITEFLLYSIFLPLCIYGICKVYKSRLKNILKSLYIIGILIGLYIIIFNCIGI